MVTLADFLEPCTRNDVVVQQSLRDIDGEILVVAFFGMSEAERGICLRNMSKRAAIMIMDDFHAMPAPPAERVAAAKAHFLGLLDRHAAEYVEGAYDRPETPPRTDFATEEALVRSFVELDRFALAKGFLALEACLDGLGEPVAAAGLRMATEGMDPLLIRSILDGYKEARLRELDRRLGLLIAGVECVAQKESPTATERRLRAMCGLL